MAVVDLGSVNGGALVPSAMTACLIASADANAQLTAMASFEPKVAFSLQDQLTVALQIVADLQAAIAVGLPAISLGVQAQMGLDLKASISANLALLAAIQANFTTGGIRLLQYTGERGNLGSEVQTVLGAGANPSNSLIIHTESPAAWGAVSGLLKVGP